jgi:hypothetical protein
VTADERTAGRRPLAVLGCLVPLVVIALLFAGSAGAKSAGKYRRPYSTAKKTAAAETTGATATATASCPKSPFPRLGAWRATGGGFEIDATYPAHGGVYESRKAGQRSWRVSAQSLSGKIVVFSYAVCRAGATKTTTASATVATPATSQVDPPSDASCPSGKAVAGGFSTPPPFTAGSPPPR